MSAMREGDEPPSLVFVQPINQQMTTQDGGTRVVTVLEVWDDRLVLRWVDFARSWSSPSEVMRGHPEVIAFDDAGTHYTLGGSGFGGGKARMDGHANFQPTPPLLATELRVVWPGGAETAISLQRR
jgi:hypothetical protein